jgi:TIR domain
MKVFVSWSGDYSKAVAELVKSWLKCVLQATEPWISTRDISAGSDWFAALHSRLGESPVGIVCLTRDNKHEPWLLFESGALAKGAKENRVCTLLLDLEPNDVEGPLSKFQLTLPTRDGMWALIKGFNSNLESGALEEATLIQVFDSNWPTFEKGLDLARAKYANPAKPTPRPDSSVLAEILEIARGLNQRVGFLEARAQDEMRKNTNALAFALEKHGAGIDGSIVSPDFTRVFTYKTSDERERPGLHNFRPDTPGNKEPKGK